jgi:hypothetical protein
MPRVKADLPPAKEPKLIPEVPSARFRNGVLVTYHLSNVRMRVLTCINDIVLVNLKDGDGDDTSLAVFRADDLKVQPGAVIANACTDKEESEHLCRLIHYILTVGKVNDVPCTVDDVSQGFSLYMADLKHPSMKEKIQRSIDDLLGHMFPETKTVHDPRPFINSAKEHYQGALEKGDGEFLYLFIGADADDCTIVDGLVWVEDDTLGDCDEEEEN